MSPLRVTEVLSLYWRVSHFLGPLLLSLLGEHPPEGPLTEDPSTQESHPDHGMGLFTTEATIKNKHFRRDELIVTEKLMFLAMVTDGQTAASWGEGKKNCQHSL